MHASNRLNHRLTDTTKEGQLLTWHYVPCPRVQKPYHPVPACFGFWFLGPDQEFRAETPDVDDCRVAIVPLIPCLFDPATAPRCHVFFGVCGVDNQPAATRLVDKFERSTSFPVAINTVVVLFHLQPPTDMIPIDNRTA
jgi:hypothetical protein